MLLNIGDLNKEQLEHPEKAYPSFEIDRPGRIIFVGHHLSTGEGLRCLIRRMSLYGADLEISPSAEMPKNFFLEILGIHDEIGCTFIRRDEDKVQVAFNMLINPEFLHHVRRLAFETLN